jgi:hypothetical protein
MSEADRRFTFRFVRCSQHQLFRAEQRSIRRAS